MMGPRLRRHWLDEDDLTIELPRVGRRLSMTISETALNQIGRVACEHAVKRLAEEIAYRNLPAINAAVSVMLRDEAWARPIVEDEIRRSVRLSIERMLEPDAAPRQGQRRDSGAGTAGDTGEPSA